VRHCGPQLNAEFSEASQQQEQSFPQETGKEKQRRVGQNGIWNLKLDLASSQFPGTFPQNCADIHGTAGKHGLCLIKIGTWTLNPKPPHLPSLSLSPATRSHPPARAPNQTQPNPIRLDPHPTLCPIRGDLEKASKSYQQLERFKIHECEQSFGTGKPCFLVFITWIFSVLQKLQTNLSKRTKDEPLRDSWQ